MHLCPYCLAQGYCHKLKALIVSNGELNNPEFVRDLRTFMGNLDIVPGDWRDQLYNWYRDYRGRIVDATGAEVFLDLEELEIEFFREWVRDFNKPVPTHVTPRIRTEARARVQVVASILRATFPEEAMKWGLRGANDNGPPEQVCV